MSVEDIRWKQRFANFQKAMKYLEEVLAIKNPDVFQRAGMIRFFEMSFELAWNMLKDYLELQGFIQVKSPREAIKKAFEVGLIADGHGWMSLLENRNLTSHTYDEATALKVERLIHQHYYPLLAQLHEHFKKLQNE